LSQATFKFNQISTSNCESRSTTNKAQPDQISTQDALLEVNKSNIQSFLKEDSNNTKRHNLEFEGIPPAFFEGAPLNSAEENQDY